MEGVEAVMTAHIALPTLEQNGSSDDDKLPASLNPQVIKILREEMKYDGLIVSDCLEMDGVRAKYGTERSAVMAIKVCANSRITQHIVDPRIRLELIAPWSVTQ
jgi:beta-N-acetylhexosaminidase